MSQNAENTSAHKIGAFALGLIIMCFALWFYTWLEKQRNGTANTLKEILISYKEISNTTQPATKDTAFAYVQGRAESTEDLVDELFQIKLRGVFYRRSIQRLKKEVVERTEGGRNMVHHNWVEWGEHPFTSLRITPTSLNVSGIKISSELLSWPEKGEVLRCDDDRIGAVPSFKGAPLLCRSDGEFSNRDDDEQFELDDIRISFSYLPLGEVSIIGKLTQGTLYPVEDQNESYLYLFLPGVKSPAELVQSAGDRINKSSRTGILICVAIFLLGLFFFTAPFRISRQ